MINKLIRIVSCLIILFGIIHIGFASPFYADTDTLWFVGAGMAIIFAGLLNFIAIDRGGSRFSITIAVITNAMNCAGFCFALPILNQPQVYVGIIIFIITTVGFLIGLIKHSKKQGSR